MTLSPHFPYKKKKLNISAIKKLLSNVLVTNVCRPTLKIENLEK